MVRSLGCLTQLINAPWKANGFFARKSLDLGKFWVAFGIPNGRQLMGQNGLIFGLGKLMVYC